MSIPAKPKNESLTILPPTKGRENSSDNSVTEWLLGEVMALGEAFGEGLTAERQAIYATSLADIPVDKLRHAIKRAIRELKWFPKIAELRELAGLSPESTADGRPGVEEAWALCPKSEETSTVWTEETAEAFEVARKLLDDGDHIAARMAFKEKYSALLASARLEGKPIRWAVSLGWDKSDRVRALSDAVRKGQISANEAYQLLAPEAAEEFLMSLPVPERKLLVGDLKRDLSQLTGLSRVLAELAEARVLPKEVTNEPRSPHKTPAERSPDEVRRLREKANEQIGFVRRSLRR